ncbi:hypothetical protein MKW98_030838 [Papaver atlanticum]|uniref:Uncharacterized protein n=1 Tax=Papaver atlanticum TaxID=357466 RepID=A0AAD4S0K3_9MAGN|nr:hypothetical protein MKW98_030838 [Papaver atlanticum]
MDSSFSTIFSLLSEKDVNVIYHLEKNNYWEVHVDIKGVCKKMSKVWQLFLGKKAQSLLETSDTHKLHGKNQLEVQWLTRFHYFLNTKFVKPGGFVTNVFGFDLADKSYDMERRHEEIQRIIYLSDVKIIKD